MTSGKETDMEDDGHGISHGDLMGNVNDLRVQLRWFAGIVLTLVIILANMLAKVNATTVTVDTNLAVLSTKFMVHEKHMRKEIATYEAEKAKNERQQALSEQESMARRGEMAALLSEVTRQIGEVAKLTTGKMERHEDRMHEK